MLYIKHSSWKKEIKDTHEKINLIIITKKENIESLALRLKYADQLTNFAVDLKKNGEYVDDPTNGRKQVPSQYKFEKAEENLKIIIGHPQSTTELIGEAHHRLAKKYREGLGVAINTQLANHHSKKAAENGNPEELYQQGLYYETRMLSAAANLFLQAGIKNHTASEQKILSLNLTEESSIIDIASYYYSIFLIKKDKSRQIKLDSFLKKHPEKITPVFSQIMHDVEFSLREGNPCLYIDIACFIDIIKRVYGDWESFLEKEKITEKSATFLDYAKKINTYPATLSFHFNAPQAALSWLTLSTEKMPTFIDSQFFAADIAYHTEKESSRSDLMAFIKALPFYRKLFSSNTIGHFNGEPIPASYKILQERMHLASKNDPLIRRLFYSCFKGYLSENSNEQNSVNEEQKKYEDALKNKLMQALDASGINRERKEAIKKLFDERQSLTNFTPSEICDIFDEIKNKDGHYAFIHELKHPNYSKFMVFLLPSVFRKNPDDYNKDKKIKHWWHTNTYQYLVEKLKTALINSDQLQNTSLIHEKLKKRIIALLTYDLGNIAGRIKNPAEESSVFAKLKTDHTRLHDNRFSCFSALSSEPTKTTSTELKTMNQS